MPEDNVTPPEAPVIPTEPVPTTTPLEPQAPITPPVTIPPVKKSHKKLFLWITFAVVLLAAGGAAAYIFLIKDKKEPAKAATTTTQTTTKTTTTPEVAEKASFLLKESIYNAKDQIYTNNLTSISEDDGATRVLDTSKTTNTSTQTLIAYVKVGDVGRKFTHVLKTENKVTTSTISYQDDDQTPKDLYTVKSTEGQTKGVSMLYPGFSDASIDSEGKSLDFLETVDTKSYIKNVDIDGKVQVLATSADSATSPWGEGISRSIIPYKRSQDNKTIYFRSYTCLQCDGPAKASIVALDIATKKFTILFSDPVTTNGGSWIAVNSSNFWVQSNNRPSLGQPSYEEEIKYKDYIFNYDVAAKTFKKIFESSDAENSAYIMGYSKEGDKVYVVVSNFSKDSRLINDAYPSQGHHYYQTQKEVREYAAGKTEYTVMKLPVDFATTQVSTLYSISDTFLVTTSLRQQSYYDDNNPNVATISIMKKDATKLTEISNSKSGTNSTFFGFSK